MPASTRRPGNRSRSTDTLPTPFCRLITTASAAACRAIRSAMSAVSVLFTATSTTPASLKIEGSSESESRFDATSRSKPSKLVTLKPLLLISSITRGRASSDTRRPASLRTPPTKQPMLPAPATLMGLVAIMLASRCSPRHCRGREATGGSTSSLASVALGMVLCAFARNDCSIHQMQAGIHPHQLAGHVARLRRSEKAHQRRDIFRG